MNYKRILGVIAILAGFGLYFYCEDGKHQMQGARRKIQAAEGLIPGSIIDDPITDAVKQDAYRRVDKHEEPLRLCFIGSGVLVVGGLLLLVFGTSNKKRRK